jgi:hypothetical protein
MLSTRSLHNILHGYLKQLVDMQKGQSYVSQYLKVSKDAERVQAGYEEHVKTKTEQAETSIAQAVLMATKKTSLQLKMADHRRSLGI